MFCNFRFRKRACLEGRQIGISCKKWHIAKSENAIKNKWFSTILDARHVKRHAAKSGKHYKTNGFQRFSVKKLLQLFANFCKSNWRPSSSRSGGMTFVIIRRSSGTRHYGSTRLGPTEGSAGLLLRLLLLLLLFKTLREHRRTPFVITASVFRAIGS